MENIENLLFYGKWKATLARNVHSTSFSHPDGETGETIPGSPISMQEHLIDVSTSSNKKRRRGVFRVRSGSEFATQLGRMTCAFFPSPSIKKVTRRPTSLETEQPDKWAHVPDTFWHQPSILYRGDEEEADQFVGGARGWTATLVEDYMTCEWISLGGVKRRRRRRISYISIVVLYRLLDSDRLAQNAIERRIESLQSGSFECSHSNTKATRRVYASMRRGADLNKAALDRRSHFGRKFRKPPFFFLKSACILSP